MGISKYSGTLTSRCLKNLGLVQQCLIDLIAILSEIKSGRGKNDTICVTITDGSMPIMAQTSSHYEYRNELFIFRSGGL